VSWLVLLFACICEVAGTLTLKFTDGMTRLWPTVLMFVFYLASLFGLSVALRQIPVGTAYAVWSALGTLIIFSIGVVWFKEPLTLVRLLCTAFIIVGVSGLYMTGLDL
jgi:small multidrug resistance pump